MNLEDYFKTLDWESAQDLKRSYAAFAAITQVAPAQFKILHYLLFQQMILNRQHLLLNTYPFKPNRKIP